MRSFSRSFRFSGFMVAFALLAGLCAASGAAFAADPATLSPDAAKRFATVWKVRGDVAATAITPTGNGKERKLRVGDPVNVGDNVRSSQQGEVVLKTDDAGVVAVRPKTEFVASRFAADDKPTDGVGVRLLSGSLRMISGWAAHTNRAGNTIETPTATVGIRGTDHETFVLSPELALATSNKEGTYDKVNRGGTTLAVDDGSLDIEPGKVGFARAAKKSGVKERGLLTLLLPVLLDRVPNFFVPGEFDAEAAGGRPYPSLPQSLPGTCAAPEEAALGDCRHVGGGERCSKTWHAAVGTGVPTGIESPLSPNAASAGVYPQHSVHQNHHESTEALYLSIKEKIREFLLEQETPVNLTMDGRKSPID